MPELNSLLLRNSLYLSLICLRWRAATSSAPVLTTVRWRLTDLAGEVMVNRQAQRLFLQGNEGCRALLAARNFPLGSPQTRTDRHAAPACGGHGAPDALPQTSRLVWRDGVRSLPHIPVRVACGATLRSEARRGVDVFPDALTVMLHF